MAMGKLTESGAQALLKTLCDNHTLVWNLSDKVFTPSMRRQLNKQMLEGPWETPAQFSQVPSLACLLTNCYAIKSWLDLRDSHVAIVHCTDGKRRTGILIACFLRYIGAFEHTSDAFDFFCTTRNRSQCAHD